MSSSSSTTDDGWQASAVPAVVRLGPVADLLSEALRTVRAYVPACYEAARSPLTGKIVRCAIDDEAFVARVTGREIVLDSSAETPDVLVAVSKQTILALIRNEQSLASAVLSGALKIRGPIDDVSALGRAMTGFLHGAIRSPALPALLERFERLAKATRE